MLRPEARFLLFRHRGTAAPSDRTLQDKQGSNGVMLFWAARPVLSQRAVGPDRQAV